MDNRYLTFVFAAFFILLAVIFGKTLILLWDVASLPNTEIIPNQLSLPGALGVVLALIVTVVVYRNETSRTYIDEIIKELHLVAWPTWKDTQKSTVIVIVFSIILGGYLFGIDKVWSFLTNLLLVSHS